MSIHQKVWGYEEWLENNELYCCKKLYLKEGYRCSNHMHKIKDETFIVEKGCVLIECDGKFETFTTGQSIRIKPGVYHRFEGMSDSVILEVSTQHLDEDSYRKTQSEKVR